jgi:hypothetical protein
MVQILLFEITESSSCIKKAAVSAEVKRAPWSNFFKIGPNYFSIANAIDGIKPSLKRIIKNVIF